MSTKKILVGAVILIVAIVIGHMIGFCCFKKSSCGDACDRKVIYTDKAPKAIGPYSQAIMCDDFLFISGQLGIDPTTDEIPEDVEYQAKLAMNNLKAILEEAKMDFKDVVQTHIFLKDINDFAKVNEIYASYFDSNYPARATMQVAALPKGGKVEIEMTAYKNDCKDCQ
jgi:2-iminobutanoate/2-iminopropanoate deaminase